MKFKQFSHKKHTKITIFALNICLQICVFDMLHDMDIMVN